MKAFDYSASNGIDSALAVLGSNTVALAGGTDLLPRMKHGLTTPARVLDIKRTGLDDTITLQDNRLTLGALATLADLEHTSLPAWCQLLRDAAALAASPQIRERATVAGNLLQRPRCWYYRDPEVDCWLKNGYGCPARNGRNEHHAIIDLSPCVAVHPSDLAACLVALNANVSLRSRSTERTVAITDLLLPPDATHRIEHRLADDELVVAIDAEASSPDARSVYLKAMDRKVWAFALVGIAASVRVMEGKLVDVSLVASGIANVPWRLRAAQSALTGAEPESDQWQSTLECAMQAATQDTTSLAHNGYKTELLARLLRDAVRALVRD